MRPLGLEAGPLGWQGQERHLAWHDERARAVSSGPVEHHGDVFVLGDRCRELVQEMPHRRGIDVGHDEGEGVVSAWLDGGKDVGEGRRALAALPPDVTRPALLPDTGLVLEEEADLPSFVRTLTSPQQRRGSF
jgi:hypothetical protein